jgi:hypothetical protein
MAWAALTGTSEHPQQLRARCCLQRSSRYFGGQCGGKSSTDYSVFSASIAAALLAPLVFKRNSK